MSDNDENKDSDIDEGNNDENDPSIANSRAQVSHIVLTVARCTMDCYHRY